MYNLWVFALTKFSSGKDLNYALFGSELNPISMDTIWMELTHMLPKTKKNDILRKRLRLRLNISIKNTSNGISTHWNSKLSYIHTYIWKFRTPMNRTLHWRCSKLAASFITQSTSLWPVYKTRRLCIRLKISSNE